MNDISPKPVPDAYTTAEFAALPLLPPDAPKRYRISLAIVRFLTYYNRLGTVTALIAVWWGLWTLAFPSFWQLWPVAVAMDTQMYGHAYALSLTLMLCGTLDWFVANRNWRKVRNVTSLLELACWSALTLAVCTVRPIFSPAAACYSAFAIMKLMAWTSFHIGIESGTSLKYEANKDTPCV